MPDWIVVMLGTALGFLLAVSRDTLKTRKTREDIKRRLRFDTKLNIDIVKNLETGRYGRQLCTSALNEMLSSGAIYHQDQETQDSFLQVYGATEDLNDQVRRLRETRKSEDRVRIQEDVTAISKETLAKTERLFFLLGGEKSGLRKA